MTRVLPYGERKPLPYMDAEELWRLIGLYGADQIRTALKEMAEPEGRHCPWCEKYMPTYDDMCMTCGTDT